jgi:hypothetical protein
MPKADRRHHGETLFPAAGRCGGFRASLREWTALPVWQAYRPSGCGFAQALRNRGALHRLSGQQSRDLLSIPAVATRWGPHAARFRLMLERYLGAGGMAEE